MPASIWMSFSGSFLASANSRRLSGIPVGRFTMQPPAEQGAHGDAEGFCDGVEGFSRRALVGFVLEASEVALAHLGGRCELAEAQVRCDPVSADPVSERFCGFVFHE